MQRKVRRAVVTGDVAGLAPYLVGGRSGAARLAIHRRHYETSLVTALLGKFPATAWLVGTPFLTEAAARFVSAHPPTAPCIAEYGDRLPSFLSTCSGADRVPYLRGFAQLEWHLGQVAIAVDRPALTVGDLSRVDLDLLSEATLTLQPGLRYLEAPWPIDDLMKLYLTETAPDQWSMERAAVRLEVRGARGSFQINRLEAGEFAFRTNVLEGRPLADAVECGVESSAAFEPGPALAALVNDGFVTAVTLSNQGEDQ
jgi:hypothetical protein